MKDMRAGDCLGHYSRGDENCRVCMVMESCAEKTKLAKIAETKTPIEILLEELVKNSVILKRKKKVNNHIMYELSYEGKEFLIAYDKDTREIEMAIRIENKIEKYGLLSMINLQQILVQIINSVK